MLTELQIINAMLAATGTAPLTVNDQLHPFYIKALNKLDMVMTEVQGRGWWFNKAVRHLRQDVNGEIVLPSNTLHCDPVDRQDKLVMRGSKMFDLEEATFTINRDIRVVFVDLVPVLELPPTAVEYIKARAVYEFYRDEDGSQPKLGEYKMARDEAWVTMKGEHLRNADVNHFDGASSAQMSRGIRTRRLPLRNE